MIKVEIWDSEREVFEAQKFVVNEKSYHEASKKIAKHLGTVIESMHTGACILSNRKILNLSKVSKHRMRDLELVA